MEHGRPGAIGDRCFGLYIRQILNVKMHYCGTNLRLVAVASEVCFTVVARCGTTSYHKTEPPLSHRITVRFVHYENTTQQS